MKDLLYFRYYLQISWNLFADEGNETCVFLIYLFYHLGSDLMCYLLSICWVKQNYLSPLCTFIKEFLEIFLLSVNLKS